MTNNYGLIWAMFYANLVAMKYHPGHNWPEMGKSLKPELDFAAEIADAMLERYHKRCNHCEGD